MALAKVAKAAKKHAADPVYEQLAAAIIDGSIPPGSALPSERELAARFSVSRLIVRQAVHKLADIGLVRVRQGGASLVVHPNDARDLRVIELVYRLGKTGAREMREMIERQFLHGFALLSLAARRASKERLRAIADIAEDYARRGAPEDEIPAFERRFFGALAEGTDNRFYMLETSWWFRMVEGNGQKRRAAFSAQQRAGFYREIARRLVEGKEARSAADFYLDSLSPILDVLGSWALLPERSQK
jgi:DNA-binding FadR family transcriptional regulator